MNVNSISPTIESPDEAVAGYGDFGMCYIGDNQAYIDRGGYEQAWSFVEPSEELLKQAIEQSLDESDQ
jgi:hypothetical protein